MPTAASAAGFGTGFRTGLEGARQRRLQDQELARQSRREEAQDQRAAEAHRLNMDVSRFGLERARRNREREDFDFERAQVGAEREDETYERQQADLRRRGEQEGMDVLIRALRAGVDPERARTQFNAIGEHRIDRIEYDHGTGRVRIHDRHGGFDGTLEQLEAAFGIEREPREPIKLDSNDRLIEPGTYRELVGPLDDEQDDLTNVGGALYRRSTGEWITPPGRRFEKVGEFLYDVDANEWLSPPMGPSGSTEERPGPAPGRTLWSLAQDGTGPVSAVAAGASVVSGMVGGPIAEQTVQARQMLRLETQNLIRSLAINPRFPVAEMERLREEISLQPGLVDNPKLMRERMVAIDEGLRRRLAQAERDAADRSLPKETREAQQQNAAAIRNFLPILGVPGDRRESPVGDAATPMDVEALPGFNELTPEEQEELRRLINER